MYGSGHMIGEHQKNKNLGVWTNAGIIVLYII
uniref:Uncharacterized protein n=1 Tax=Arundo donax TaxID=35708 RepID=A0A0A9CCV4_ARUDO